MTARCGLAENRNEEQPREPDEQPGGTGEDGGIGPQEAARRAMAYLEEISGTPPEMVTAVTPEDGGWYVNVELLELARIPDSSDILGSYEVALDESGQPRSYRRTRRYVRTQVGDE